MTEILKFDWIDDVSFILAADQRWTRNSVMLLLLVPLCQAMPPSQVKTTKPRSETISPTYTVPTNYCSLSPGLTAVDVP